MTVEYLAYNEFAIDAGLKYRGWSFQTEYYQRKLSDFVADGPLPLSSITDRGLQAQLGYMVVPQPCPAVRVGRLRLGPVRAASRTSFRPASAGTRSGTRSWRLNLHTINVYKTPAGSTFGYYASGPDRVDLLARHGHPLLICDAYAVTRDRRLRSTTGTGLLACALALLAWSPASAQQFNSDNYLSKPAGVSTVILTIGEQSDMVMTTFSLIPRFEFTYAVVRLQLGPGPLDGRRLLDQPLLQVHDRRERRQDRRRRVQGRHRHRSGLPDQRRPGGRVPDLVGERAGDVALPRTTGSRGT